MLRAAERAYRELPATSSPTRGAAAFGVASYPAGGDPDKRSLEAAYNMEEEEVRGLKRREN